MKSHDRKVLFSSGKDDWKTPQDLFDRINAEFKFDLDLAADARNSKCPRWLGPGGLAEDALAVEWFSLGLTGWCNPPYTLAKEFVEAAAIEQRFGFTTVMLLPSRTDTRWWHNWVWNAEHHQWRQHIHGRFLRGRLKFVGAAASAPFPSVIVVFDGRPFPRPSAVR